MRIGFAALRSSVAIGAMFWFGMGSAWAQTASSSPVAPADQPIGASAASASGTSDGLTDIIVTARRTAENLQSVPLTVTALTTQGLKDKAVRDIYDLQLATPSLTVEASQTQGRSSGAYVIHGQKASSDDSPPGVVNYLNDVPVNGGEIARALFDLESVQVLKGPQGTLFGRNTNGGAILFNTVKPRDDFEGYVTGRYGNLNDRYGEGAINVPLSDSLAIRAAGNIERRDGFTKNTEGPALDNLRYGNGRVSVRFHPTSDFENILVFNYTNINERGPAYIPDGFSSCNPAAPGATATCYFNPALGFTPGIAAVSQTARLGGLRSIALANPSTSRIKAFGISNTTNLTAGPITFKNIFGYHDQKFSGFADYDGTDYTALSVEYNRHTKTLTDEVQAQTSLADDKLKLIVGGFYLSTSEDPFCGPGAQYCATSAGQILQPLFFVNPEYEHIDGTSKALFAQASYKLSDALTLTGGYRYTWDRSSLTDTQNMIFYPGTILLPFQPPAGGFSVCSFVPGNPNSPGVTLDPVACSRSAHAKFAAGNYIGSISWTPIQDVLTYATFRHGYKSGGLNTTSAFAGNGFVYNPEKVNDLEVGLKTQRRIGDVDVRFNVSGFYDWYKNLQQTNTIFAPSPQSLTQNVGAAHLWGGEVDLVVVPVHGLTLEATGGYFEGKFTRGIITDTDSSSINLAGRGFQTQPKFTYTLTASYAMDVGSDSKLTPSVFYTWRKGFYFTYDTNPNNFISAYGLLNARIDLTKAFGTGFDIGVFGKNITNKLYAQNIIQAQAFGFESRFYGEPRTYGVQATFHFGSK